MIVHLPWQRPPMTKNKVRRLHHYSEAILRRQVLDAARYAIRSARLEPMVGANVTLHWRMETRRRQDGDGADPTKAACIDALVLEGVLPDDSWVHLPRSGVQCHPPIHGQPGALWLELTDPDEEAQP